MIEARWRRWLLYSVAALASISFALALGSLVAVVIVGRDTDRKQCESASNSQDTLRTVLTFARTATLHQEMSLAERREAKEFWDQLLELAPPIVCTRQGSPKEGEGG